MHKLPPIEEIVAAYQAGNSACAIAKAVGYPPPKGQNRIVRILKREGVFKGKLRKTQNQAELFFSKTS